MSSLENTKVYRGGVTAPHLSLETRNCWFAVNQREKALELRFRIASKGGGVTEILLQIGSSDLSRMLEQIATKMPENVGILSHCAALANKRNLEILEEVRALQGRDRQRLEALVNQLESVEQFVSSKYYAALAGEDSEELEARQKIEGALDILKRLVV